MPWQKGRGCPNVESIQQDIYHKEQDVSSLYRRQGSSLLLNWRLAWSCPTIFCSVGSRPGAISLEDSTLKNAYSFYTVCHLLHSMIFRSFNIFRAPIVRWNVVDGRKKAALINRRYLYRDIRTSERKTDSIWRTFSSLRICFQIRRLSFLNYSTISVSC